MQAFDRPLTFHKDRIQSPTFPDLDLTVAQIFVIE